MSVCNSVSVYWNIDVPTFFFLLLVLGVFFLACLYVLFCVPLCLKGESRNLALFLYVNRFWSYLCFFKVMNNMSVAYSEE